MKKTTQYHTCPDCGAHLDHSEVCECKKKSAPGAATPGAEQAVNADQNNTNIIPQETEPVNPRSFWLDLDDLHFRMACAINNVCAIHEAMENGDCSAECYTDALWAAGHFLGMLNKELGAIVTDMRDAS